MTDQTLAQAIKELRQQAARIEQVIRSLEPLASGKRRRGRPPKILAELSSPPSRKKTPVRKHRGRS